MTGLLLGLSVVPDGQAATPRQDGEVVQAPARGPRAGGPARGGRRGAPAAATPTADSAEVLFERYVRRQARVALQLSSEEMRVVEPRLAALQATRRRLLRERQRHLNQLAQATRTGGGGNPEVVRERLDAFEAFKLRADTELRDAVQAVEQVLSVEQRARFAVFERQMERRKLELMSRARREAGEATVP